MKQNRLDGVLARNRKNVLVDLVLAAVFPMALLFSGMAVGATLPALSAAPKAAPRAAAEPVDASATELAPPDLG